MLTPEQVIPFLSHGDPDVRLDAAAYLAGAHDPSPATADDLWRAIDALGLSDAPSLVERLELLPQTDASIARTFAALPEVPGNMRPALWRVIRSLSLERAKLHLDAIKAIESVPPHVLENLEQRLALADEPVEPLWDRLMEQAAEWENRDLTEADALAAERLIEALARRPDFAAERTVALLRDSSAGRWREIIATDLAGEMRLRTPDAVDALLDKLRDEESDILWDTASEALVRAGDVSVVAGLADRFPKENWSFQVSATGVLGRIKRPESEAALVRLMADEEDEEVRTLLASALLDLCPTNRDVLEQVRRLILEDRYDPGTADLRVTLLTVGAMVGYAPEEAEQWRAAYEAERKRWERGGADAGGIMASINSRSLSAGDLGSVGHILGLPDSRPLAPLRPTARDRRAAEGRRAATEYTPAQAARPIRRETAKVGRNDPCPCGSGKKHKKCCMKN